MAPYALQFSASKKYSFMGFPHTIDLNPSLNKSGGSETFLNQETTATTFSAASEPAIQSAAILTSIVARLFYVHKSCYTTHVACKPVYVSNPVIINAKSLPAGPNPGPGALIGSSTGSGKFASTSVSSGNVPNPSTITIRVSTSPTGENVHVNWDLTCSKGSQVKGSSGSFDDTSPVDDFYSVSIPSFAGASFSCEVTVGATIGLDANGNVGGGLIALHVYSLSA